MFNGSTKTIKVGFLTEQSSGWMGGVNYFKNLFIAMSKVDNPKIEPYIIQPRDEKAKVLMNYAKIIIYKKDFHYRFTKLITKLLGKKFNKEQYLQQHIDIDVVSHDQSVANRLSIAWIPDFQHVRMPEMFSKEENEIRNYTFKLLAKNSALVILSSQDALNDFKNFAPEHAGKGRILHFVAIPEPNIYQRTDNIKEDTIRKIDLPEKYFYLPNQFWKHKNHKVVFEALALLKKEGIDVNIVCTGNTKDYRHADYFEELGTFAKENKIDANIKILGLVDLIEVYYLMRNCISIINPSFFEGWSSTVEEAKSLGKNIILSNINVHKEQNPNQGIYFDPHNPNELSEILKTKWLKDKSAPDFELEKIAKSQIENRIIEFGETYQKIILEALDEK